MAVRQIVLAKGQQENLVLMGISDRLLFTDVKMSGDSPGCKLSLYCKIRPKYKLQWKMDHAVWVGDWISDFNLKSDTRMMPAWTGDDNSISNWPQN